MSYWSYAPRPRDDVVAIPRIWLTIALSLLLHALALWLLVPHLDKLLQGDAQNDATGSLAVQLKNRAEPRAPQTAAATPPPPEAPPPPRVLTRPPRTVVPPRTPAPPVVAVVPPQPVAPVQPPPALPVPAPPVAQSPAPPPIEGDLAAYIASRRRARGETGDSTAPSAADAERARRDAIVASNIGSLQASTFGNEPRNGGGTFQIRRLGFDDAEFTFFGWNRDIGRRAFQVIEVRRGTNGDINIAIVRRIIEIIRDHEQNDFRWDSKRLGREVILSARLSDNTALESFMLQEFFTDTRRAR